MGALSPTGACCGLRFLPSGIIFVMKLALFFFFSSCMLDELGSILERRACLWDHAPDVLEGTLSAECPDGSGQQQQQTVQRVFERRREEGKMVRRAQDRGREAHTLAAGAGRGASSFLSACALRACLFAARQALCLFEGRGALLSKRMKSGAKRKRKEKKKS